jgi:hypothetical protein
VSVDSETHDQEWAMVNAVGRRSHNSGGNFSNLLQLKRFKKIATRSESLRKMCVMF